MRLKAVQIEGLQRVVRSLQARAVRTGQARDVLVGFSAAYAIWVHEILTAHHPVGEAKYLERPYVEMKDELIRQIGRDVAGGMRFQTAILRAGLRLQRAAQGRVPVDTGNLRASAFTELD